MLADSDSFHSLFQPAVIWIFIPVTAIVASFWYKIAEVRSRNSLKQSMVERGMSAQEIDQVLKA